MLPNADKVRLLHMLDAARKAVRFAAGRGVDDLKSEDEPLGDALVRLISVIGEAGTKVSQETRSHLHQIPWPDVVGMRHRLVHDYFDINWEIVWATVQYGLPPLIEQLESALGEGEQEA